MEISNCALRHHATLIDASYAGVSSRLVTESLKLAVSLDIDQLWRRVRARPCEWKIDLHFVENVFEALVDSHGEPMIFRNVLQDMKESHQPQFCALVYRPQELPDQSPKKREIIALLFSGGNGDLKVLVDPKWHDIVKPYQGYMPCKAAAPHGTLQFLCRVVLEAACASKDHHLCLLRRAREKILAST